MRVIALEIPDDPSALPGWIERQLVGLDLAPLVAELEVVHGAPPPGGPAETLDGLLGDRRGALLERGLSSLPPEALRGLLRRPRLLIELQEVVLFSGGPYWRHLAEASDPLRASVDRARKRLAEITSAPEPEGSATHPDAGRIRGPTDPLAAAPLVREPGHGGDDPGDRRRVRTVARAGAARGRVRPGWGWNRPGALPQDVTSAAYLDHLAVAAADWFAKRPDEPISLARRIAEFREGCSVLILSEHRPLSAEDRAWLVAKCRAWAAKLDAHLTSVEAGDDPAKVRAEADDTIGRLIDALRERARGQSRAEARLGHPSSARLDLDRLLEHPRRVETGGVERVDDPVDEVVAVDQDARRGRRVAGEEGDLLLAEVPPDADLPLGGEAEGLARLDDRGARRQDHLPPRAPMPISSM